ncbi:hypothetical protein FGIG_12062 [Fasciola gigantica]|uniref:Uncharacterized protein n=1 Tax=Fasciola gigantica TaxID=46835 RepID=A0A504YQA4_FASGI|nr:hypothetical protein FGIG_12062 [Fasciola gigantica]
MFGLESVFPEEMCVPTEPQGKKCYNSIDLRKLAEENARLRSKVDSLSNALDEQKIGFERKCGAVEYELEEYRKTNKVLEAENKKRFAELVHQVS